FGVVYGNVMTNNSFGPGLSLQHPGFLTVTGNIADSNATFGFLINGRVMTISGNLSTNNGTYGYSITGATAGRMDHGHIRFDRGMCFGNTSGEVQFDSALTNVKQVSYVDMTP